MIKPRPRRFDFGDALVLALAAWLAVYLVRICEVGSVPSWSQRLLLGSSAVLIPWTGAFLIIRLRSPRPTKRRLVRQPGMLAACAGAVAMVPPAAWLALVSAFLPHPYERGALPRLQVRLAEFFGDTVGLAVAVAWLVLWSSRAWRNEPGWIDRLGRVLGWAWIAEYVARRIAAAASGSSI